MKEEEQKEEKKEESQPPEEQEGDKPPNGQELYDNSKEAAKWQGVQMERVDSESRECGLQLFELQELFLVKLTSLLSSLLPLQRTPTKKRGPSFSLPLFLTHAKATS